jgi:hypothetical protein
MTQTLNNQPKQPANYLVNPHKLEKYLPQLLNGEAHKLKTWLPNLLSLNTGVKGTMEREGYDHWLMQYSRKDPAQYNTKMINLIQKVEMLRQAKDEVLLALADFKESTDSFREKNNTHLY